MNNKKGNNTYHQLNLKIKIKEQADQKQTQTYRGHFAGCQVGGGLGDG